MSIILFNVMPQLIDILVACTYLASALKGPWVALIVLFTVGSYVPLTLLITEQRGKVGVCCGVCDEFGLGRGVPVLCLKYRADQALPMLVVGVCSCVRRDSCACMHACLALFPAGILSCTLTYALLTTPTGAQGHERPRQRA